MRISSICVYCGSSPGKKPAYVAAARHFGRALVERGMGLVYGGAKVGVMGAVADEVLAGGGNVVGVIPRALALQEVAHDRLSELIVTESMHERKTIMADRADAFVALPGGIGTLEELFEAWTWAQLGFHGKPCGLLNVEAYFDALVRFLDHAVTEEYLQPSHRAMLAVEVQPGLLIDRLVAIEPTVPEGKWPLLSPLS